MKYLSKPIIQSMIMAIFLGMLTSTIIALFFPAGHIVDPPNESNEKNYDFDIVKAFNLKSQSISDSTQSISEQTPGEYILRDFNINGIFLDGKDSLVIVKDAQNSVFLHINEEHKGYTLSSVFIKKAKFSKGIDTFWAFLDPIDEKEFVESPYKASTTSSTIQSKIRTTTAREMFEDIKYKNGTYYIPKDTLMEYTDISKLAGSVAARPYLHGSQIMFNIVHLSASSVLYKIGLRKGDFITQINKENFKSIQDPIKYYQNMKSLTKLSITIQRVNQEKELKYEIY